VREVAVRDEGELYDPFDEKVPSLAVKRKAHLLRRDPVYQLTVS